MFVDDNPCDDCLVKMCCINKCEAKINYTNNLMLHRSYFLNKYTIQKRGVRYRLPKKIPKYQQKEWDRLEKLYIKDQLDIMKMFQRKNEKPMR